MILKVDMLKEVEVQIRKPSDVMDLLRKTYGKEPQENFLVVPLDNRHRPIKVILATKGLVNQTMVHPREIFREAIALNSAAVIVAHNHPSGDVEPSKEDDEVTRMLVEAGKIIGIEVIEHLVFTYNDYYSYCQNKFDRIGGVH